MPSIADLEAAGSRAAVQPVPVAPAIDALHDRAGKHQNKRRLVGSAVVVVAFMALAVPAALSMRSQSVVQEVAAGAAEVAPAASQGSNGNSSGQAAAAAQTEDADEESTREHTTGRFEMRFGDVSFSGRVLTGDAAIEAAADAEAAADETREVDGQTVWISRDGDRATVSSLIDGTEFVEVVGPGDQLDRLLDIAASGAPELPPLPAMPGMPPMPQLPEIEEFFEGFDGLDADEFFERFGDHTGDGFNFHFDFDFDEGTGEHPRFEFNFGEPGDRSRFDLFFEGELGDALKNGEFSELEEFFDELERDFGDFEQRFESGDFDNHPFFSGKNFDGCISISGDGDQGSMSFEFPPGCRSEG